jgi:hypothetical protein
MSPSLIYFQSTARQADTVILDGEQGLHIDYWDVDPSDGVLDLKTDCRVWLSSNQIAGFMICVAPSKLNAGHLVAGITLC